MSLTRRLSVRGKNVFMTDARVILMDNTTICEKFEKKQALNGLDVLRRVGDRLGLCENELKHFGLKYPEADGRMSWLSLSESMKKVMGQKQSYNFQLGVRFYPDVNDNLSVDCLRLCCYQIKSDLNRGDLCCHAKEHAAIDSYLAQAVIGDYSAKVHTHGYLEDYLGSFYIPPSGLNCHGEVKVHEYENDVVKRHKSLAGTSAKEAWLALLDIASTIPRFNALTHQAKDCIDKQTVNICIYEDGLKVYKLNALGEPDCVKRQYEWRTLAHVICYKKKLVVSTSKGLSKFKFSGMYGGLGARRLMEDILECRLFHNCHINGTNILSYYTDENGRNSGQGTFTRRTSRYNSFRNEPVLKRQGSMRRVYSSLRSRLTKSRESRFPAKNTESDEDFSYRRRRPLSRIEMIPHA